MRVIARIVPGTAWRPGRTVHGQGRPVRDHLDYMRDRFDAGDLLLGGPLADGMSGVAVLEVQDLSAAEAFAKADPAVAAGVLAYDLSEVVVCFEAATGSRYPEGPRAELSSAVAR